MALLLSQIAVRHFALFMLLSIRGTQRHERWLYIENGMSGWNFEQQKEILNTYCSNIYQHWMWSCSPLLRCVTFTLQPVFYLDIFGFFSVFIGLVSTANHILYQTLFDDEESSTDNNRVWKPQIMLTWCIFFFIVKVLVIFKIKNGIIVY